MVGEYQFWEMSTNTRRGEDWCAFAEEVLQHIHTYTIPQYGDWPQDQMTEASMDDIRHDMQRYLNRMLSNARGQVEAERDMLKLAHYACIAYCKIKDSEGGTRAGRGESAEEPTPHVVNSPGK